MPGIATNSEDCEKQTGNSVSIPIDIVIFLGKTLKHTQHHDYTLTIL